VLPTHQQIKGQILERITFNLDFVVWGQDYLKLANVKGNYTCESYSYAKISYFIQNV
jgi:hypothetical protein